MKVTVKIALSLVSEVASEDICIFKEHKVEDIPNEPEQLKYLPYYAYRFRRSIEVTFYGQKFFWSFGNYMVRNKSAIERYVNPLAVAFTFVQILPFIREYLNEYQLKSP